MFNDLFAIISMLLTLKSFLVLLRHSINQFLVKKRVVSISVEINVLLLAHGRKPSKANFHGPITWRISEEDRRNV